MAGCSSSNRCQCEMQADHSGFNKNWFGCRVPALLEKSSSSWPANCVLRTRASCMTRHYCWQSSCSEQSCMLVSTHTHTHSRDDTWISNSCVMVPGNGSRRWLCCTACPTAKAAAAAVAGKLPPPRPPHPAGCGGAPHMGRLSNAGISGHCPMLIQVRLCKHSTRCSAPAVAMLLTP
jgi:hypothetical protein